MKKILLIEDDVLTSNMTCDYLTSLNYKVTPAYDGETALVLIKELDFDLVILDIMLPKYNGIDILKIIRENDKHVPVIMLTALSNEDIQIKSFDNLADDYITKPFAPVLLVKRIEALLRRSTLEPENTSDIWIYEDIKVDFKAYTALINNTLVPITPKELKVLQYLLTNKNIVLTREHIIDSVWGKDSYIVDRVVDNCIKNIRKKLAIDCIITVKGVGYKMELLV